MKHIKLDDTFMKEFVSENELVYYEEKTKKALDTVRKRTDWTGFVDLPEKIEKDKEKKKEFEQIKKIANEIKENADVLVVVGIGGSYLGARAGVEFLKPYFGQTDGVEVIFAGYNLSGTYLNQLVSHLKDKVFYVNIISKSGTTLEPAATFRVLKQELEKRLPKEEVQKRIIATTDKKKGTLKEMSNIKKYRTLVVPDDIGGRYSVLTAVGLLPLLVHGVNIDELVKGAKDIRKEILTNKFKDNDCMKYASFRHLMYMKGKDIEVFSTFEPNMHYFSEWLKQLFGESECKGHKGLFPASLNLSSDLHSLGQLMQDGKRNVFETFIQINKNVKDVKIQKDNENLDGLNYIASKSLNYLNKVVHKATEKAHANGDVPNMTLTFDTQDSYNLGQLFYFFEMACAISATMLDVDPFNQPGVEEYKKYIKILLKK